jgi:hypothetical protein
MNPASRAAPRKCEANIPTARPHQFVFKSYLLCILGLSPSTSPSPTGGRTRCPLKTTPAGRPVSAGIFGEGRETENAQQSKKKDYENKSKFRFRAQEPDRTAWEKKPSLAY